MPIQQMFLGAGKKLTTETFNGSGNWTAPAGVTSVNLLLIGSEDHPANWYSAGIRAEFYYPASSPPNYATEAPTQTSAVALVNTWRTHFQSIAGTGTAARTISGNFNTTGSITNLAGTTHNNILVYSGSFLYGNQTMVIRGNIPAFTSVTYGQGVGNWAFSNTASGVERQATAQQGSASIFGSYTAAGAPIGGSPTTIQQTISVTPGQSYAYTRGHSQQYTPYRSTYGTCEITY